MKCGDISEHPHREALYRTFNLISASEKCYAFTEMRNKHMRRALLDKSVLLNFIEKV